jgi:lipid-A-disaccharide synthase
MANLIAERRVLTELIQGEFRPDTVAAEVMHLLDDPERRSALKQGLAEVRRRLGGRGASARAAEVVRPYLG